MPKLAANLTMLFNEVEFLERFDAAAAAGFRAVEYLFPYAHPAAAVSERLRRAGLEQVLHNLPAGDWGSGERGIGCHPDRIGEFQDGVGLALDYAFALSCPRLNCLAGIAPPAIDDETLRETFVSNLRFAAAALEARGIELLIEPINTVDIPGYWLSRTAQALEIIDAVGAPNLRLQYDIYHAQVMEGDLARTIESHLARIGHMQLADNPGRHEPGTGEIRFEFLLRRIDELGYGGWIGCEYRPAGATEDGLGWAAAWL